MSKSIAVLGGTGKTGREVIRVLVAKDGYFSNLAIYVRSKSKLLELFPGITSDPRVNIFESSITDTKNMTQCLSGVQTIICTIGENENLPGIRVIQDAATSILAALSTLSKQNEQWRPPRLLLLSSSTWNERFAATQPRFVIWLLSTAFHHPYTDLRKAQSLLLASPSLVRVLLVQPPALVEDDARGYEISTEFVHLTATYADLAAGFVEAATTEGYENLDAIGVSSLGPEGFLKYGPELLRRVVKGLLAQYVPGFWAMHRGVTKIFAA
jgi:NAD(P)H-binding